MLSTRGCLTLPRDSKLGPVERGSPKRPPVAPPSERLLVQERASGWEPCPVPALVDPLGSALVSLWVYQIRHGNVRIEGWGRR